MKRKTRRKLLIAGISYLFLFMNVNMPVVYGAASGNYTDLLPIGAPSDTTVISRGSGWAITTLPVTQTFGDSLSRVVDTIYQSTSTGVIANSSATIAITAISTQGFVGSTTFPATWVATGRSFRINAAGNFSNTGTSNWSWSLLIGTMTLVSISSVTTPTTVTNVPFVFTGIVTVGTTGAAGTALGSCTVATSTSANGGNQILYSSATIANTTIDWTTQHSILPNFRWWTNSTSNSITFSNVTVETLN